jgi:hypothetical protein|tara:strand:- start:363 stop:527 length:165 start_codon:yes stop_codon:yes gene_type:complete
MIKAIRILEIPILLLCLAAHCFDRGSNVIGTILVILSIFRLIVNSTTDEFNYKK